MAKTRIHFKEAPDNSKWPTTISVKKETDLIWLIDSPIPPSFSSSGAGFLIIYMYPENEGYSSILLNPDNIKQLVQVEV